ncbi:MAG: 6-bladed beta-propeller, partial [Tannerella sp.]|nr:6-bladed beta-propeller [Tannerella sp.]
MKKLPLLLIFLAMISCIQRGKIYTGSIESGESDKLSEMALSVTAIPLETNSQCQLSELQQIRYISSYIFIRSNNAIYRFTQSGRFINRIEIDPNVRLRRFTVNPDKQHLIVLDSLNAVHFYSFDGKKLFDV